MTDAGEVDLVAALQRPVRQIHQTVDGGQAIVQETP
jgi:hypothetical protein